MDRKKLKAELETYLYEEYRFSPYYNHHDSIRTAYRLAPKVESLIAEETKGPRAALSNLIDGLKEVDDAMAPVILMAAIHGTQYKGPKIEKELAEGRKALKEAK